MNWEPVVVLPAIGYGSLVLQLIILWSTGLKEIRRWWKTKTALECIGSVLFYFVREHACVYVYARDLPMVRWLGYCGENVDISVRISVGCFYMECMPGVSTVAKQSTRSFTHCLHMQIIQTMNRAACASILITFFVCWLISNRSADRSSARITQLLSSHSTK